MAAGISHHFSIPSQDASCLLEINEEYSYDSISLNGKSMIPIGVACVLQYARLNVSYWMVRRSMPLSGLSLVFSSADLMGCDG
ncbi:MAG: hypothetical protein CL912_10005 [Deltaproteobacteria bacterium]|nr:hypothetical protein [Deltaproteobacteria bacterium]